MRSAPILALLLAASLLVNVVLAVRASRAPESGTSTSRPPASDEPRPAARNEARALRESLALERTKNAELLARIELLETDKAVLAQEAPGAAKTDKVAAFREKIRRLMKVMKDANTKADALDPEAMAHATEIMMEFMKLGAVRAKEPKTYAEYLHAFYDISFEGEGTSLTPAQSAKLSRLFQEFGDDLSRVPPTAERMIRELELEKAMVSRLADSLTESQRKALAEENMEILAAGALMSSTYVSQQGAADQIARQWSSIYHLEESQLPQARIAAQAFVDAVGRLEGPSGVDFTASSSPEAYDRRIAVLRQQLAALQMLQPSMTPAQQELLRTLAMREIQFLEGVEPDQAAPPKK